MILEIVMIFGDNNNNNNTWFYIALNPTDSPERFTYCNTLINKITPANEKKKVSVVGPSSYCISKQNLFTESLFE